MTDYARPGLNPYTLFEAIQEAPLLMKELFTESDIGDFKEIGWESPTPLIKSKFGSFVDVAFEEAVRIYQYKKPELKTELTRLKDEISILFWKKDDSLTVGKVELAYEQLATVIGKINYLIWLFAKEGGERDSLKDSNIEDLKEWVDRVMGDSKDFKNLSNRAMALYFYFAGKIVTPNNLDKLGLETGRELSDKVYQEWLNCDEPSYRVNKSLTHHHGKYTILEDYMAVLPLLEKYYPSAYSKANAEFEILKKEYQKEYNKIILRSNS
jgi:hypothetical protein